MIEMDYFDENQQLIFPPQLQKLIDYYDVRDTANFESISFRHSATPTHFYTQSPRKKGSIDMNKFKGTGHFSSSRLPLPDLDDNETKNLRKNVNNLEEQSIDLDVQIQGLKKDISRLEKDIKYVKEQINPPRELSPAMVSTPVGLSRTDLAALKGKNSAERAQYYKTMYEKEKNEFDGLKNALSRSGGVQKTTIFRRGVHK